MFDRKTQYKMVIFYSYVKLPEGTLWILVDIAGAPGDWSARKHPKCRCKAQFYCRCLPVSIGAPRPAHQLVCRKRCFYIWWRWTQNMGYSLTIFDPYPYFGWRTMTPTGYWERNKHHRSGLVLLKAMVQSGRPSFWMVKTTENIRLFNLSALIGTSFVRVIMCS